MLGVVRRAAAATAYDLAMLDLDGVVYVGGEAVPGAPEHLRRAREAGDAPGLRHQQRRPDRPSTVAEHLRELGVDGRGRPTWSPPPRRRPGCWPTGSAPGRQVVAARRRRAARRPCAAEGLEPVAVRRTTPVAVVTGYGPDVLWRDIMRAAVLVRDGLPWVASNTDLTIPTAYGVAPGPRRPGRTMLRGFAGVEPVVAGKPQRPLLDETVRRVGGERPLMVGDRLDTDIEGAAQRRLSTRLLVLTGVTGLAELVGAPRRSCDRRTSRPTSAGLLEAHAVPRARTTAGRARRLDAPASRDGAAARRRGGRRRGTGGGSRPRRPGPTSTRPASRPTRTASTPPDA